MANITADTPVQPGGRIVDAFNDMVILTDNLLPFRGFVLDRRYIEKIVFVVQCKAPVLLTIEGANEGSGEYIPIAEMRGCDFSIELRITPRFIVPVISRDPSEHHILLIVNRYQKPLSDVTIFGLEQLARVNQELAQ